MRSEQIVRVLTTLRDRLHPVLESDGRRVLSEVIGQVTKSAQIYSRYKDQHHLVEKPVTEWGYNIFDTPLRFKICKYNDYQLRADIICNLQWSNESSLPHTQELVLRVWSADRHIMYRPHLDSDEIGDRVTGPNSINERVMIRYHFDLANQNQAGPKYHLQSGGKAIKDEFCWFPKELDLPRLIHHPLDLVLLCQIVVANFFPDEYQKIRKDPAWISSVKMMEESLLIGYYTDCLNAISDKKHTLLDNVWNIDITGIL